MRGVTTAPPRIVERAHGSLGGGWLLLSKPMKDELEQSPKGRLVSFCGIGAGIKQDPGCRVSTLLGWVPHPSSRLRHDPPPYAVPQASTSATAIGPLVHQPGPTAVAPPGLRH